MMTFKVFSLSVLLLFFLVSTAFSEPCIKPEGEIYEDYWPYDRAYIARFYSLFLCHTSTAQEINDFMHSALTDEELDPYLTSMFLATLSTRSPAVTLMSQPIRESVTVAVLKAVRLKEKDVDNYLERLKLEAKQKSQDTYINAKWDEEALMRTELDTRMLLLPMDISDAIQYLQICRMDLWNERLSMEKRCIQEEKAYRRLLHKYRTSPQILKNMARGKFLAERLALLINERMRRERKGNFSSFHQ
jgi:hypothetical protein